MTVSGFTLKNLCLTKRNSQFLFGKADSHWPRQKHPHFFPKCDGEVVVEMWKLLQQQPNILSCCVNPGNLAFNI